MWGKSIPARRNSHVKTLKQNVPRVDMAYEVKIGVRMSPWVLA